MKEKIFDSNEFEGILTDKDDQVLILFKNDLVSLKGEKKGTAKHKARINCKLAVYLYRLISSYLVLTHFDKQKSEKEILVKPVEELPFHVKITNWQDKQKLSGPKIEYIRDDEDDEQVIDSDAILSEEWMGRQSLTELRRNSLKINVVLTDFFKRRGLDLTTLQLRFGKIDENLGVCRPITFDRCELKEIDGSQQYDYAALNRNSDKTDGLYQTLDERIIF
ncbi:MAG: phosphoribosylaminoimidazolesuccinocarboxamide synthase [candidate division KSB1 bacterium]|nr:phosphoribosylaminoimidazolesuccinocarboxamide synthase [candidate division KSB1 bacterium]